jgi:hypothetical protein
MKLNPGLPWQKQHSTRIRLFFTSKLDLHLSKKLLKFCISNIALYGPETWTLQKVDQKCLESFEMCCWRRIEKINWTSHVKNEVLRGVKEERNILRTIKRRQANCICDVLHRKCLLKHVIEGRIEVGGKTRKKTYAPTG